MAIPETGAVISESTRSSVIRPFRTLLSTSETRAPGWEGTGANAGSTETATPLPGSELPLQPRATTSDMALHVEALLQPSQALAHLRRNHLGRVARLALLQRFTHAHDGGEIPLESCPSLAVHRLVRFVEAGTSLAVPEDDVVAEEVAEHVGGDLARVRPVALPVHVLCTEF